MIRFINFIPWYIILAETANPSPYYHWSHVTLTAPATPPLRNDSFFGYSVAYEPVSKKFIVGAPNANILGKVFECNITTKTCSDNTPKIAATKFNNSTRKKDGFWLGAAIQAGRSFYVVCAPRTSNGDLITWYLKDNRDIKVNGTAGQCYVRHIGTPNQEWKVMTHMNPNSRFKFNDIFDHFQDSLAWSLSVSNNNVLMGGPAMSRGKAAIYFNLSGEPTIIDEYDLNLQRNESNRNAINNFGYTVYMAEIMEGVRYFVSSPFGHDGKGQIYTFKFNKNHKLEVENHNIFKVDDAISVLYGASMCHINIKTEKEGQLYLWVVGSPAYRDRDSSNYDVGIVHVYNFKDETAHSVIKGKKDGGYFGNTLATLGDLNGDNQPELAISAPYEDDGRGAVYIYSGVTLLQKQPLLIQKIQPEGFRYLGLSLTAMPNLDDNGCSGLGIGAPGSGNALVLHCMASVVVKLSLKTPELQNRHESKLAQVNETHFQFTWCLNLTSAKKTKSMAIDFKVSVKVEHQNAILLDEEGLPHDDHYTYDVFLNDSIGCRDSRVYLPINGFYEKPLYITVTAKQQINYQADFDPARVVLSDLSTLTESKTVWAADCRNGSHCEPRLNATAVMTVGMNYVIGSTAEEALKIEVSNSGETAYNLCVSVRVRGVRVKLAAECEQDNAHDEWRCPAPGPLRRRQPWILKDIILEMSSLNSTVEELSYVVKVLIHCSTIAKVIPKTIRLQKDVQGVAIKGIDNFEGQVNVTDNLKKHIDHKYTITNNGTTKWVDLKFVLTIPRKKYIEYSSNDLTIRPETATLAPCSVKYTSNSTEVVCKIDKFEKGQIISVFFTSTVITKILENGNVSLETTLTLELGSINKTGTIRTLIQVEKIGVPVWIIVAAAVIGVLLLLLVAFIMHETGILKRKNRVKLKQLRTSVRRQTMRQSLMEAFQDSDNAIIDQLLQEGEFTVEDEGVCHIHDMDEQINNK